MDFALNNATDVIEHYRGKDQDVDVESWPTARASHAARRHLAGEGAHQAPQGDGVPQQDPVFGLQQHQADMEKKEGRPIEMLPGTMIVPLGVVRLMELQEQGWSYVRP